MAFDLATAKARTGIQPVDYSKDVLLQSALDAALGIAEQYCDRKFLDGDEVETLTPVHLGVLSLHRYPVATVTSITLAHNGIALLSTDWHVGKNSGLVYVDGLPASHEVTVTYHGGYNTLPADLELALFLVFDAVWAVTPGGGKTAGAGSVGATGAIKSVSTPDVGSVSYYDPTQSAAAASAKTGAGMFLTFDAMSLLAPYRRMEA
jgi:hypothetical protein